MNLEMTERSGVSWVALHGRLDTPGVDAIDTRFTASVVASGRNAVVDLTQVAFVSSMGIRLLLTAARALGLKKARLVLLGAQPIVRETLEHVGLSDVLPVADNEAQALAILLDRERPTQQG